MNTSDKINQDFLKQYSAVFAEKLLNAAYENKAHLNGKDILSLSDIKQLNLFVIKSFFNEWQEEVKKLESPLFDYSSREVRKSMIGFMNTLSQHISIKQEHLKPYLERALHDTILLASNIPLYLQEELTEKKSARVTAKFIKSQLKYIVAHKEQLLEFFTSVEGESVREALNKSELYFEDFNASEEEEALISQLSGYLVLEKTDLYIPSFQPDNTQLQDEENVEESIEEKEDPATDLITGSSDYFDQEVTESSSLDVEEQPEREESPSAAQEELDVLEEESVAEEQSGFDNDAIAVAEEHTETEVDGESEASTEEIVADNFTVDQKTLAELHEEKKIESVFEAISINHRYMFLQELFDGDNELFTTALKEVDACDSFDEAVEKLVQNYAKDFFWDMNSDEVKELLKVVYRKFRG
jgi:hypothetical protein